MDTKKDVMYSKEVGLRAQIMYTILGVSLVNIIAGETYMTI